MLVAAFSLPNLALGHGGGAGEATEAVYTTWGLSQRDQSLCQTELS